MNIRFIINERAGQGKGLLEWRKLRADAYPHDFTRSRGHATELARQIIQQQSEPFLLIVVGGDGTIHEVLNGVAGHSHVTVGVVKAGSGNDFAREFPSFTCLKAIENFSEAISVQHRAVDFGQVRLAEKSSRYFASNCGFGLDAEISLAASQSKWKKRLNKWKLGHLVYVLTVVRSLLVFTPFEAIIQNGNEKRIFNGSPKKVFIFKRVKGKA
ncbi:hypothetical protein DV702_06085 [Sporosarcina sp. PTS2304]|uniref:diacylglycerol/lipid kinase family protein n=1 Tax=Sporosarcina sp. PTS2304 TaxID=2283194 RepID=UPI000E0CFCA5|nr:diacylglycerol kinase family protein [Sporosarcina sp. PTS2304]AXH99350.1 hypothetical protein DV702_06085 [Sporosarcina sp. PTS2304]